MNVVVTPDGLARVEANEVLVVDLPHADVGALLVDRGSLSSVADAPVVSRCPLHEATLLQPLGVAGRVFGIGLNYRAKAKSAGRPIPDEPILFLKPSSSLVGPGAAIRRPQSRAVDLDYEGELAVVVGRVFGNGRDGDAWEHMAGITAANDTTARDVMSETKNPMLAKGFDRCAPIGASVCTLDSIADLGDIGVKTELNGDIVQQGRTTDLIFPVPELVARLSRYVTLQPGDIILTGTPPGTGQDRGRFLASGDEVTVTVDGVLPLRNAVADQ